QRVPVARVDAGELETRGKLAEADGAYAPLGVAQRLLRGQLRIPQRDQAERDVGAVRRPAPFLDHPVVVRLHAREAELAVLVLVERLPAEARERGERERAVDPVERHVLDALVAVVATRAHLVV